MPVTWHTSVENERDDAQSFKPSGSVATGFAIGIIAVNLPYPKIPGNVACATTFNFPVLYEEVNIQIEHLFAGESQLKDLVIEAAIKLEMKGVRAIVGACGFLGHFQRVVAQAVRVPVYLSSLVQIPLISLGLKSDEKILVLSADAKSIGDELLEQVGASDERLVVSNVGDLSFFAAIRYGEGNLESADLSLALTSQARQEIERHPEIRAILLECSDLPPYAAALQRGTGLAVFDFITLINWVFSAVVQKPYRGFI